MGSDFIFPNWSLSEDPAVVVSPDLLLADVEHGRLKCLKNIHLQNVLSIDYPHLVERVSEAEVGDGLGVLEGGVGPVHPHVPPDQLLLLLAAPEGDPGLPRQLLPLVNGAPEIVLPESTLQMYHVVTYWFGFLDDLPLLLIGVIPLLRICSVESLGASNEGFNNIALLKFNLGMNLYI